MDYYGRIGKWNLNIFYKSMFYKCTFYKSMLQIQSSPYFTIIMPVGVYYSSPEEITYANNCVFHCVHKEIDNAFSPGANYLFHESGLQITLRLLSSSLGNTVLLHSLFLKYETQIAKKKLDNVFQSNCSSHAKLLTKLRKIEKRPKMRHKVVMHPALQMLVINKYMIPCLINLNNWLPRDVRGFSLSWHSSSAVGKKMKKTPDPCA